MRSGDDDAMVLTGMTILLDCRWLGVGGAGRVTELLLRGLRRVRPPGRWVLWGGDVARSAVWEGAAHEWCGASPSSLWGQRSLLTLPRHDVAVYMHQVRPLRPGPSLSFVYDTIPLRYGASPVTRWSKRAFLKRVAALSSHILTLSRFAKSCIRRDLAVPSAKVTVLRCPVDEVFAVRVDRLRKDLPQRDVALYVGRFARHKNVERLIVAFSRTQFARHGGTLLLAGGTPEEARRMHGFVSDNGVRGVAIEPSCAQERLEELYATSRLLVLPSLEEGFGLPAWEAMTCGLPLCVSDGGSLPEVTAGRAATFPALSTAAMAAAIDRVAVTSPMPQPPPERATPEDFAADLVGALARTCRLHTGTHLARSETASL